MDFSKHAHAWSPWYIGVDLLVDGSSDTYWQSDGMQPHTITLHFQQYVAISKVAIQTNYRMDESYTPQRLSVSVGTRWSDMSCIRTEEVIEPQGWIVLPIASEECVRLLDRYTHKPLYTCLVFDINVKIYPLCAGIQKSL